MKSGVAQVENAEAHIKGLQKDLRLLSGIDNLDHLSISAIVILVIVFRPSRDTCQLIQKLFDSGTFMSGVVTSSHRSA
jgi:hypothetical protein